MESGGRATQALLSLVAEGRRWARDCAVGTGSEFVRPVILCGSHVHGLLTLCSCKKGGQH